MKKIAFKSGAIFGILLAVAMIAVNSVIAGQISLKIVVSGIVGAVVGGLVYGVVILYFLKRGNKIQIEIQEDEKILKEGAANHKVKFEAVGGKLFLTNERLVFQSHKINVQNHLFALALNEIKDWRKYKTLGLFSNGLKITTQNNATEKFVVNKSDEWIRQIEKIKNTQ